MITKRILPCLDVKNGRVVKGVNFEGLQDMADPVEMARYYNASGADELVFYDITASVEGRQGQRKLRRHPQPRHHPGGSAEIRQPVRGAFRRY